MTLADIEAPSPIRPELRKVMPWKRMAHYVSLGDKDEAMNWLEKGYAERFSPGVLIRPGFDPLRSDPRFQNLLHRIGLPG